VAAISFPELPGPPVIPDPSRAVEPDGSEPAPSSGAGVPVRDRLLGAGVVFVLFAILVATAGWRVLRDDAAAVSASGRTEVPASPGSSTSTVPAPDQWPVEVQPLVAFIEENRGGLFDHPVPIRYLDEADYKAAITGLSDEQQTAEEAALQQTWEAQMRALGLVAPGTDLSAAGDQLAGEGTLAFYDSDADVINVLGTELDVAHQVTLVHELTHAWQDQHGFLDGLDQLDPTPAFTLKSLVEGDARRIEYEYVRTLSDADMDRYVEQSQGQADEADLSGVPDVLIASLLSQYELGGPFTEILATRGGNSEVDDALSDPPPADADLIDPRRYIDGTEPVPVDDPAVPAGAEVLDSGDFGAISWLLTLSERVDPHRALEVVDGWAGDRYVVYRADDRTCTVEAYRGTTSAQTTTAADQMREWAAASPGLDATVETVGDDAVLRSCEPAAGAEGPPVAGRSTTALELAALRVQLFAEVYDLGTPLERSSCIADQVVGHLTTDQIESGAINDPATARRLGAAAGLACP
jgi:hypothetical protein